LQAGQQKAIAALTFSVRTGSDANLDMPRVPEVTQGSPNTQVGIGSPGKQLMEKVFGPQIVHVQSLEGQRIAAWTHIAEGGRACEIKVGSYQIPYG
jgi:hypothetical protein